MHSHTHSHDHSHCSCGHHGEHSHADGHDHHDSDRPRKIYVYSPSGAVEDKAAFRRGIKVLQKRGHEVEIDADALSRHQRFAGDDETRLAAIARATASQADVALISRGGYGLNHLLGALDYAAISQAIDAGLQYAGFSDFTAFQLAVLAKTGRVTWASASVGADFGRAEGFDEITLDCFEDILYGIGEGAGWRLPKTAASAAPAQDLLIEDAMLWGGNLAVLTSLLATPFWPEVDGGILFLEDVGEHPYKVERMLMQLEMAGVLAQQKAIVLGQFNGFKLSPHDKGFKLQTVIQGLQARLNVPILTNLPFGHVETKVSLPVGAKVSLQTQGRDALLVWGHIE